jgi:rRNA maturation endonuclease Nob1
VMGTNNGNHGARVKAWRAWCRHCQKHLVMSGHHQAYPDELRCPLCGRWCKVLAAAKTWLKGDVVLPPGSGRHRVEE